MPAHRAARGDPGCSRWPIFGDRRSRVIAAPRRRTAGARAPAAARRCAQGRDRERLSAGEPSGPGNSRRGRQRLRRGGGGVGGARGGRTHRVPVSAAADSICCIGRPTASKPCSTRAKRRRRAASRDMYLDKAGNAIDNASIDGPLAAAIPGEPAAFEYLARKYGKLPLEAEPAAGDSPGARWLSAVCAPARRHPLQARGAAAFARRGEGVSDGRTAPCPKSAPSSSSRTWR